MTRVRWRIDRVGVEALCDAWWQGEHGAAVALAWPAVDGLARDEVVARVKSLIKRGVVETPGDAIVVAQLPAAHDASTQRAASAVVEREALAAEARRSAAVIARTHTPRLLQWLSTSRVTGTVSVDADGRGHPGVLPGHLVWTSAELKSVLEQREHVERSPALTEKRREAAGRARAQRQRKPRPPRR
jgi:hypothetical protein